VQGTREPLTFRQLGFSPPRPRVRAGAEAAQRDMAVPVPRATCGLTHSESGKQLATFSCRLPRDGGETTRATVPLPQQSLCGNRQASSCLSKDGFILHKGGPKHYSSTPGADWETGGLTPLPGIGKSHGIFCPFTASTLAPSRDQGPQCTDPASLTTESSTHRCKGAALTLLPKHRAAAKQKQLTVPHQKG